MANSIQLRGDIQGLRAIAVLGVIIYHINKNWLPGGFVGVDIFFVISGFLIAELILRKKNSGDFSLRGFYKGRIQRIVPAYLTMISIVSLGMAFLLIPKDFETYTGSVLASVLFKSNIFFSSQNDYFAPASHELPLLHTWSLAIEMQFYLLLPLFLIVLPRRVLVLILSIIAISLIVYSEFLLLEGHQRNVYFSLLARIPEFLVGAIAAILIRVDSKVSRFSGLYASIGLLLIAVSFLFIDESMRFPGVLVLLPCIGATLVLISRSETYNRVLSLSPLLWIGTISYSLYLWHWPFLSTARYISGEYELNGLTVILVVLLTFLCASLSYLYVEAPLRQHATRTKFFVGCSILFSSVFAVMVVAYFLNPNLAPPLPENLTRYATEGTICHARIVGDCLRGNKSSDTTLLMLGDSHAAQLNMFADVVGAENDLAFRVITSSNCVTIPGFDIGRIVDWARETCNSQIEAARHYVLAADGIVIAGMWQYHAASDDFMLQFDKFLSDAESRGQKVLVLAQIPMFSTNPQRIYRADSLGIHLKASENKEWVAANAKVKALVVKHGNAYFMDLSTDKFFADAPLYHGVLIYQDNHHLNEIGSVEYGRLAASVFRGFVEGIKASRDGFSGARSRN